MLGRSAGPPAIMPRGLYAPLGGNPTLAQGEAATLGRGRAKRRKRLAQTQSAAYRKFDSHHRTGLWPSCKPSTDDIERVALQDSDGASQMDQSRWPVCVAHLRNRIDR